VKLKYHDRGISHLEGIISRGDRRLADVIEHAWEDGARFDGWDELFDPDRWQRALDACGVDPTRYLGTIPVRARLPWDHIDVGLEDGFLLGEYRKALKDRLSPPCGKPAGELLHHSNLAAHDGDARRLVCYDCGVACDLGGMKAERRDYLVQLGAAAPVPPRPPVARPGRGVAPVTFAQGAGTRYRLRYAKLDRTAFISHLDVSRLLQRVFRRAGMEVVYSLGHHPRPQLAFGPALTLGAPSLGELFDVRLDGEWDEAELAARLSEVAPDGLKILGARRLADGAPVLSKAIQAADWLLSPAPDGLRMDAARLERVASSFLARATAPIARARNGEHAAKTIDARAHVIALDVVGDAEAAPLRELFGWDAGGPALRARVYAGGDGSVRPVELSGALGFARADVARLALVGLDAHGAVVDPLSDAAVAPLAQGRARHHERSVMEASAPPEALS
jgi:radical SAM-linked protein